MNLIHLINDDIRLYVKVICPDRAQNDRIERMIYVNMQLRSEPYGTGRIITKGNRIHGIPSAG